MPKRIGREIKEEPLEVYTTRLAVNYVFYQHATASHDKMRFLRLIRMYAKDIIQELQKGEMK